jgi:hypothetical protein
MISDQQAEDAQEFIHNNSERIGDADARTDYLISYQKVIKSQLYLASNGKTVADREAHAYVSDVYKQNLLATEISQAEEVTLRFKIDAAKILIELYRTQQANNRKGY